MTKDPEKYSSSTIEVKVRSLGFGVPRRKGRGKGLDKMGRG